MEDINEITSAYDIAQNELDLDPTVDPLSGISYYNTTVRTRLMLAICLEGFRCRPKEDASRCQILHAKCNEHVDTTHLSFKTRIILSECTVIDILCHLGHRSLVYSCQQKYTTCLMVTAGIDRQGIKLITDADLEGGVSDEDDLTYLLGIIDKQGSQVEDVDETKKTLTQITKHSLSGKENVFGQDNENVTKLFSNEGLTIDNETLFIV